MSSKCLKDEEIIDYMEDRSPQEDRLRAEQHLSECDPCLERIVAVRGIVSDASLAEFGPVPERVTERAVRAVLRLEDHSLPKKIPGFPKGVLSEWFRSLRGLWSLRVRRLASVRSSKRVLSEQLILIKKSFPEFDAEIEIEKVGDGEARIWVMVADRFKHKDSLRVSLFSNGREMSSYLLKDSSALFDDIPFEHYVLIFYRDGTRIGEFPFEIKESRYE